MARKKWASSSVVECLICNEEVRGSIPRWSTASLKLRSAGTMVVLCRKLDRVYFLIYKKQCPAKPWCSRARLMYFVYILKSQKDGSLYVGSTDNVKKRLTEHNAGESKYSSSKRLYVLKWFCAYPLKSEALSFEKYLKHGSGFAFARKHLVVSK